LRSHPTPFASGGVRREHGISKAGNRRARHAAVELAWLWLYWQPDTALARWFRTRLGTATGRFKRIMIVALARKLMIALWRFLNTGRVPDGAILKA
jgi:transposase